LAAVLLAALGAAAPGAAQFASVRVQVVDVGQGDGIVIRTPNQRWILIDAGPNGWLADALAPAFGIDRLAVLVVSHRHRDHFRSVEHILRALPVDRFVGNLADCPDRSTDDGIRAALEERRVAAQSLGADTLEVDGVRLIVLPPDPVDSPCPGEENDNSVLIRLEFGRFSMLFAGDAERAERDWLVAQHPALLDVDVLKASHHGSENGTSTAWLEAVSPGTVVISAGVHGTYRHPMPGAVAAYEAATRGRVFCTNRHGTLRVYGFPDGRVAVYRQFVTDKSCVYDGAHY
jgi:competence protein ComEC